MDIETSYLNKYNFIHSVLYLQKILKSNLILNYYYFTDNGILPVECKETADVLLFFDNLFDSVNGSFTKNRFAKPLLGPVTPHSKHHEFWMQAKKVLKSMKFITDKNKIASVPTINNWVWTLESIESLIKILIIDHNVTSFWMRHLNQIPIETFLWGYKKSWVA